MSNNCPLYSVIVDGAEVSTVDFDDDEKIACNGKDVKFIDKKVPSNVKSGRTLDLFDGGF